MFGHCTGEVGIFVYFPRNKDRLRQLTIFCVLAENTLSQSSWISISQVYTVRKVFTCISNGSPSFVLITTFAAITSEWCMTSSVKFVQYQTFYSNGFSNLIVI
ncbi:hypothetical protein D3C80_1489030 [compost metagenome]